jgi:hypothetical protein
MADDGIWRDIEKARLFERTHKPARPGPALLLFDRRVLAGLGVLLLGGLIVAIASKFLSA